MPKIDYKIINEFNSKQDNNIKLLFNQKLLKVILEIEKEKNNINVK